MCLCLALVALERRCTAQQTFVPTTTGTYSWIQSGNWSPTFPVFPDGQNAVAQFVGLSTDAIRTVELDKDIVLGALTLYNPSQQGGYGVTLTSGGDGTNELFFVSFGSNSKIENRIGPGLQDSSINTLIQVPVVLGSNLDVYGDQRQNDLTGMNLAGGIIGSADRTFTKKNTDSAGSSTMALEANVTIGPSQNFDGKIIVEGGGVHSSGNNLSNATGITVNSGGQFIVDSATPQLYLAGASVLSLSGAGKPGGFAPEGAFRYQDGNNTSDFTNPIQLRNQGATIFVNATDASAGQIGTLVLGNQLSGTDTTQKLIKSGDGTLVLANATGNTYGGGTDVLAGTLRVGNTSGSGTGTGAVNVFSGAQLAGVGSIAGPVTVSDGAILSPGDSAANFGVGTLTIDNNVTINGSTAVLSVDLAGSGAFDRLQVNGDAALAGTLDVHLANGFHPALGDSFAVLNFASATGDFNNYAGTNLGGYLELRHTLSLTNLVLTARPALDGDITLDGVVNGLDVNQVATNWLKSGVAGDVNGDGVVNGLDINVIASHWLDVYGGAAGNVAVSVPEPSGGALALMVLLAASFGSGLRRCRRTQSASAFDNLSAAHLVFASMPTLTS
ncbi:MAG TPA: autotransporter-associated beta strand repeat-containing protein [Pirellulales bacterium]